MDQGSKVMEMYSEVFPIQVTAHSFGCQKLRNVLARHMLLPLQLQSTFQPQMLGKNDLFCPVTEAY